MLERIQELLLQVKQMIEELPSKLKISAQQITVNALSDIAKNLGLVQAGEFRAGNGKEPGSGFTGIRIGYPPFLYNGEYWHDAGVNDDVLQTGRNVTDGKFYAAGGNLVIDQDAIKMTELGYALTQDVTVGTARRISTIGMSSIEDSTVPTLKLSYQNPTTTGSNIITYGDFESGDLTGWTATGYDGYSASTSESYADSYSLYANVLYSGGSPAVLTSQRYAVDSSTSYIFKTYCFPTYLGRNPVMYIKWYDDPSAGSVLRTDSIFKITANGAWTEIEDSFVSPSTASSCEIILSADTGTISYVDDIQLYSISQITSITFEPIPKFNDGAGNEFLSPPPCILMSRSSYSLADNTLITPQFEEEHVIKNTDNMLSTKKIYISTAGIYHVFGSITFPSNTTGHRSVRLAKTSGATVSPLEYVDYSNDQLAGYDSPTISVSGASYFDVGDGAVISCLQNSGGALSIDATLGAVYLGNYNA